MQQFGIGGNWLLNRSFAPPDRRGRLSPHFREFEMAGDVCLGDLGLMQLRYIIEQFAQTHSLKLWLWHLGKITKSPDDRLQVGNLREQHRRALAKRVIKLLRALFSSAKQILDRQLKRKQRILQLMRQAARQLPPSGDAFRLHQPLALLEEIVRHAVEGIRQ